MSVAQQTTVFGWDDFQNMKVSLTELKLEMIRLQKELGQLDIILAQQIQSNHPEYTKVLSGIISLMMLIHKYIGMVQTNLDIAYIEIDETIFKVLSEIEPESSI